RALGAGGDATADRVLALPLDVTDEAAARSAARRAADRFGAIDVLVNNAGHGLAGAIEETTDAQVAELFETNVLGLLRVTRAVLPLMRARRAGHIINIGSVAGFCQGAGSGIYGATKFAVEGITEALQAEVSGLGIAVTVVEPGQFRTDFLAPSSLRQAALTIDDYAATAGARRREFARADGAQPGDPVKAADVIVELSRSSRPPLRLQLGADCLDRVEAKLTAVAEETRRWRHLAEATDHGTGRASPAPTAAPAAAGDR
ncbi:SDR family NAD(P)-dependent oxidoreductase, partial [Actinomadura roseirufa]|uniref:SDR family NAD(P)-dependent oxidoreductase n=1 Tax=Actinomadura roseirufa TaxID=2094049 RepID=UPI001040F2D6